MYTLLSNIYAISILMYRYISAQEMHFESLFTKKRYNTMNQVLIKRFSYVYLLSTFSICGHMCNEKAITSCCQLFSDIIRYILLKKSINSLFSEIEISVINNLYEITVQICFILGEILKNSNIYCNQIYLEVCLKIYICIHLSSLYLYIYLQFRK